MWERRQDVEYPTSQFHLFEILGDRHARRVFSLILHYTLDRPMLTDELEGTCRSNVLDPLREVCAEEESEVDEALALESQYGTNFGAGDQNERTVATPHIANQRHIVYEDILKKGGQLVDMSQLSMHTVSSLATKSA